MDNQKCHFCGCVFGVSIPRLAGHEESEEYSCPECYTEYRTRASNTPSVSLISSRTDGRTINIYEKEKIEKEIIELENKLKDKRE